MCLCIYKTRIVLTGLSRLGALAAILVYLIIKEAKGPYQEKRDIKRTLAGLDSVGILFLITALVCLLLALQWGGLRYSWSDARIVVLLASFAILIVMFFLIQRWVPAAHSSVPLHIVCQRSIVAGCIYYVGWGGGFMPLVYFVSLPCQKILCQLH